MEKTPGDTNNDVSIAIALWKRSIRYILLNTVMGGTGEGICIIFKKSKKKSEIIQNANFRIDDYRLKYYPMNRGSPNCELLVTILSHLSELVNSHLTSH